MFSKRAKVKNFGKIFAYLKNQLHNKSRIFKIIEPYISATSFKIAILRKQLQKFELIEKTTQLYIDILEVYALEII